MKKKIWAVLLTAFAGLGLGYHLALNISEIPAQSNFNLDIETLRAIARSGNGDLPSELRSIVVSETTMPGKFLVAGQGWQKAPMVFTAFQVTYSSGHSPIIIDTAWDQELGTRMHGGQYHPDKWEELEKAMLQSAAIVVTHEHPDHIGGIAKSSNFAELAKKFVVTAEQKSSTSLDADILSDEQRKQLQAVSFEETMLLAPGVVLLKAPGHAPGNLLIFVALQSGDEFLFVGDIGWSFQNLDLPRGRPWAISKLLKENREDVAHQLRALHGLIGTPSLHLIVAHDKARHEDFLAKGIIQAGFVLK